jgi:hypothetical protein
MTSQRQAVDQTCLDSLRKLHRQPRWTRPREGPVGSPRADDPTLDRDYPSWRLRLGASALSVGGELSAYPVLGVWAENDAEIYLDVIGVRTGSPTRYWMKKALLFQQIKFCVPALGIDPPFMSFFRRLGPWQGSAFDWGIRCQYPGYCGSSSDYLKRGDQVWLRVHVNLHSASAGWSEADAELYLKGLWASLDRP